jgi:hypothetical protein
MTLKEIRDVLADANTGGRYLDDYEQGCYDTRALVVEILDAAIKEEAEELWRYNVSGGSLEVNK